MHNLKKIIADISGKKAEEITPDSILSGLRINSSIGLLKLQSALEKKFNKKLKPLSMNVKVEMIAQQLGLDGNSVEVNTERTKREKKEPTDSFNTVKHDSSFLDIFIGVDIEEVASLPKTENLRTHEFYSNQFNDVELSYAMLMPDPYVHLCGMFCAKEALKKSAPDMIALPLNEIIVSHNSAKRPSIGTIHNNINLKYQFQVSISHTEKYATATVIAIGRESKHVKG